MQRTAGLARQRQELNRTWSKWRISLILLVILVVVAVVASYAYRIYLDWSFRQHQAVVKESAQVYAKSLGRAVAGVWPDIDALIDRQALARLIASGGVSAIETAEQHIAARNPDVLKVWVLPRGTDRVDYSSRPPLSYAALDLLRRSLVSDQPLPAEVHLAETDTPYIAVARPVADNEGHRLGEILFALDASLLSDAMARAPLNGDYAELRQVVPGSTSVVVASRGQRDLRSTPPDSVVNVPGTQWQLAFWLPAKEPALSLPRDPALLGAGAAAAAVLFAGVGWAVTRRRKASPAAAEPEEPPPTAEEQEGEEPAQATFVKAVAPAWSDEATAGIEVRELEEPGDTDVPESIFRAYDIRGVVGKTLGSRIAQELGRAIGSEAHDRGQQTIVVGRDGRQSSPELGEALIDGLRATGRDVIDIGRVPTPVLYFATHYLNTGSGVMVTGSHNPPEYNGLKILLGQETLFGDDITALRTRLVSGNLVSGTGGLQAMDVVPEYVRAVSEDVPVALGNAYKVVVDCGNGVAGEVAPKLLRALGHEVTPLYCEVDGRFPHHHPDPSQPQNLRDLAAVVREHQADLGFAFDGDGDRLGVVDGNGRVLWPDRQMMLFARDVLSRNRGAKIVYDVKCTNLLAKAIRKLGGEPIMWRTGHSYIKSKMRESGALLAGEMSGHIFFKERWYGFDDALYAAARMLEILLGLKRSPTEIFARLPSNVSTPELRVDMAEGKHLELMERLTKAKPFQGGRLTTIDGLRVDYPDGWGLVRASNTTPCLVLRFEGTDEKALKRIQEEFKRVLLQHQPSLSLSF
jgi:phosphomannomutase/phosphoglucomutase